jgi:hypothetical protein
MEFQQESDMLEIFDTPSIEANKQGKKSEKQVKEIKEAANPGIWLYGGLGVLLLGGCSYAAMSQMEEGGSSALNFLAILLAAVGLFAALRGFSMWNLRRKLLKEPVQTSEGTVTYQMKNVVEQLIEADHYNAETNDGKILHPIGLAGINPKLPPGLYNFYYLKPRNWLLSSEPLFTEAEMRTNLNTLLAIVLGYDQAHLENCRMEAQAGKLSAIEGLPILDVEEYETGTTEEDKVKITNHYCTLGGIKFGISSQIHDAIFEKLPYRAYYQEEKKGQLAAIELA